MSRFILANLLVLILAAPGSAQPSLKTARERWLRGNYDECLEQYEKLAKDEKLKAAVALGVSRVHESRGDYDKALEVVDAALKDTPKDADLLARQAELLHIRGRWDEAEKAVAAALAINKDHFAARWVRAQIYRARGDIKKADDECRWFVRIYSARSEKEDDIKDAEELLRVGLAGAENARWHSLSDQFEFILNDIYADALKYDKSFWPAEYEAGVLLLEKFNRPEALASFDKALTLNPNAAKALAGKGVAALMKLDLKEAESFAERALKINPNLPEALRLRADLYLFVGDFTAAQRELEKAEKVNPRAEQTLARIAACFKAQRKDDEFNALVKEIEKFDPKPAVFWFELGEQTEVRRFFSDAEKYFRKAADLRPTMPGPLNSLGLLYMRLGREKGSRRLAQ